MQKSDFYYVKLTKTNLYKLDFQNVDQHRVVTDVTALSELLASHWGASEAASWQCTPGAAFTTELLSGQPLVRD